MNSISLNEMYSTTRILTEVLPLACGRLNSAKDPALCEGGLRAQGLVKFGYKKYPEGWFIYRNKRKEDLLPDLKIKATCDELPLITVVTVVFNADKTLEETIRSVIGQTYSNIEYIIIDGGSTDTTLEILKKYNSAIDYWKSEKDNGIYDAMNKSLLVARGDWLIFMGADDRFSSDNSIECVVSGLKHRDAVYHGDVVLSKSCKTYGGRFNKYKLMQQNICHQAIFYPACVYAENTYNLKYRMLADYKYNVDAVGRGVRFNYLPIVVSIFNEAGISSVGDVNFADDKNKMILRSFGIHYYFLKMARNVAVFLCKKFR